MINYQLRNRLEAYFKPELDKLKVAPLCFAQTDTKEGIRKGVDMCIDRIMETATLEETQEKEPNQDYIGFDFQLIERDSAEKLVSDLANAKDDFIAITEMKDFLYRARKLKG